MSDRRTDAFEQTLNENNVFADDDERRVRLARLLSFAVTASREPLRARYEQYVANALKGTDFTTKQLLSLVKKQQQPTTSTRDSKKRNDTAEVASQTTAFVSQLIKETGDMLVDACGKREPAFFASFPEYKKREERRAVVAEVIRDTTTTCAQIQAAFFDFVQAESAYVSAVRKTCAQEFEAAKNRRRYPVEPLLDVIVNATNGGDNATLDTTRLRQALDRSQRNNTTDVSALYENATPATRRAIAGDMTDTLTRAHDALATRFPVRLIDEEISDVSPHTQSFVRQTRDALIRTLVIVGGQILYYAALAKRTLGPLVAKHPLSATYILVSPWLTSFHSFNVITLAIALAEVALLTTRFIDRVRFIQIIAFAFAFGRAMPPIIGALSSGITGDIPVQYTGIVASTNALASIAQGLRLEETSDALALHIGAADASNPVFTECGLSPEFVPAFNSVAEQNNVHGALIAHQFKVFWFDDTCNLRRNPQYFNRMQADVVSVYRPLADSLVRTDQVARLQKVNTLDFLFADRVAEIMPRNALQQYFDTILYNPYARVSLDRSLTRTIDDAVDSVKVAKNTMYMTALVAVANTPAGAAVISATTYAAITNLPAIAAAAVAGTSVVVGGLAVAFTPPLQIAVLSLALLRMSARMEGDDEVFVGGLPSVAVPSPTQQSPASSYTVRRQLPPSQARAQRSRSTKSRARK